MALDLFFIYNFVLLFFFFWKAADTSGPTLQLRVIIINVYSVQRRYIIYRLMVGSWIWCTRFHPTIIVAKTGIGIHYRKLWTLSYPEINCGRKNNWGRYEPGNVSCFLVIPQKYTTRHTHGYYEYDKIFHLHILHEYLITYV